MDVFIRHEIIDALEASLFEGNLRKAFATTMELLQLIERRHTFSTPFSLDAEQPDITALYTRLAAVMQQIMVSDKFNLTDDEYFILTAFGRASAIVFETSGFYVADHLLRYFSERMGDITRPNYILTQKSRDFIKKYLAVSTFSVSVPVDFESFFKLCPELAIPAFLTPISYFSAITPQASENRERLLGYRNLPEKIRLPSCTIDSLTAAYMMCSYGIRRDKHQIKQELNKILRHMLHEHKMFSTTLPSERARPVKPKIICILEAFDSKHAMYRCFSTAMAELKQRFELVSISFSNIRDDLDDTAKALFDRNISILSENNSMDMGGLQRIVQKIKEEKPDVIYFPSIGMRVIAVTLSNLRLAPIQIMTMGSPASTYSDCIDYAFMEEDNCTQSTDLCSEKLILLPPDTFKALPVTEALSIEKQFREKPEPLMIAIPAKVYKLNPAFLNVCKKIKKRAGRSVIFHFFPNDTHVFFQVKREIIRSLPCSFVYPPTPIKNYLEHLNAMDIYLATFPFSGSNSFVDAACLGLPVITLQNEEMHGVFEAVMIKRLGLPDWLIAKDEDAYVDAAVRLIQDDDLRIEIGKSLAEKMQFFLDVVSQKETLNDHYFADAVWQVYQKHEALQQSDKRAFSLTELMEWL